MSKAQVVRAAPGVCLFSGPGEDCVDEGARCVDDGEFVHGGCPVRPPPLLVGREGPLDDGALGVGGGGEGALAPAPVLERPAPTVPGGSTLRFPQLRRAPRAAGRAGRALVGADDARVHTHIPAEAATPTVPGHQGPQDGAPRALHRAQARRRSHTICRGPHHSGRPRHTTPPLPADDPQNLAATTTRPTPRRPLRRQQALHNPHHPSPTTHNPDTRPIPHPAPPSETRPSGPGRGSPRPGGSPRCRGGRGPRRGRRRRRAPRRARPAAPRAGHGSPRGRARGSGSG